MKAFETYKKAKKKCPLKIDPITIRPLMPPLDEEKTIRPYARIAVDRYVAIAGRGARDRHPTGDRAVDTVAALALVHGAVAGAVGVDRDVFEAPFQDRVPAVAQLARHDRAFQLVERGRLRDPTLLHGHDGEAVVEQRTHDGLRIGFVESDLAHVEPRAQVADAGLDGAIVDGVARRRGDVAFLGPAGIGNAVRVGAASADCRPGRRTMARRCSRRHRHGSRRRRP